MPYSSEIYSAVSGKYSLLISQNAAERERRRHEIYENLPRIKEIDENIADMGLELTRSALSHSKDIDKEISEVKNKIGLLKIEKDRLLKKNGYPADYYENVFNCKECGDTGFVNGRPCDCFNKLAQAEAYKASGLGEVLGVQNFDAFNLDFYSDELDEQEGVSPKERMSAILRDCKEFAAGFPDTKEKGLLLYGDTGRGKTFLSSCIAKAVLDKGYTVIYQTAPRIFAILEEARFGQGADSSNTKINALFSCDLLIIDDLGTEFSTRFTVSALFDIINSRMLKNLKTIISSNLSNAEINEKYSTRIFSRLTELKYWKCIGEDIRLIKKFGG